jgi:hypothetical protein
MPVYGAPPLPVIPLALMALAIVVGAALFYMSQEDKKSSGGISPQQASAGAVLHLEGVDITEAAFRREIGTGISKGNIPCAAFAGQTADNLAAGLKLGGLKMTVPTGESGVAVKSGQQADDASLKLAAQIVLDSCPKGAAPAQQQQQPPAQPPPGQTQPGQPQPGQPGGAPPPAGTPSAPAVPPGGQQPPAATPRPGTPAPPPPGR